MSEEGYGREVDEHEPAPVASLVEPLERLDAAGVDYCLLRNYEFLDGEPPDTDVDLLVPRRQRARLDEVLTDAGFVRKRGGTTRHVSYRRYVPELRRVVPFDVALDGPGYNGLPIVDVDRVLENRRRHAGAWIPRDEEYFVQLVFHGAMNKGGYRPKYRRHLETLRDDVSSEAVLDHGAALFGDTGRSAIQHALLGEFDEVVALKWRLVAAGASRSAGASATLVRNLLVYHQIVSPLGSLLDRLRPSSPVIALLGPDGSGKTTVADGVADALQESGYDARVHRLGVYNDETLLMRTAKAVRNRLAGGSPAAEPETRRRGEMSLPARNSRPKAVVHLLDIWLRYARARLGGGDAIVADRFVHDLYVHDDVSGLEPLISASSPSDLHGFVLTAPPAVVAERSEYDRESIEEMLARLEAVPFDPVDVDRDPDVVIEDVLARLFEERDLLADLD